MEIRDPGIDRGRLGVSAGPILIWGAGAIGGTVGAYLVRAGHAVRFVDVVAEHVAHIRDPGLAIEGPIDRFAVTAPAFLADDLDGAYRRVFLCVKAQHTAAAVARLAPFLADDGYVVSLQNGLNEEVIAARVGRDRTIGAFVNFGADYLAPGRVLYGGRGAVVVGELDGRMSARLDALRAVLRDFEPRAIATDDIRGYLWGKIGYGALLYATALTDAAIADVFASRPHRPILAALAREATMVARAKGIAPKGFNGYEPAAFLPGAAPAEAARAFDAMAAHNRKSAKSHSGIWRDLAVRKRRTEVDAQLGAAVAAGAALGQAMPLTRRLIALIHDIEEGRRPLAWSTLDALGACHAD